MAKLVIHFISAASIAIAFLASPSASFAVDGAAEKIVSCDCLGSSCGSCEIETGVEFYSEKCGPQLSRVKSCKKPQCAPVANQNQCLAALGLGAKPKSEARSPAAAPSGEPVAVVPVAARVTAIQGHPNVNRAGASVAEALVLGADLRVGDVVETDANGRVKLAFVATEGKSAGQIGSSDSNEAVVGPRTRLTVEAHRLASGAGPKRTVLFLHRGGVRSALKQTYDGAVQNGLRNEYLVRTRAAVAGVRGTDFLTLFDEDDNDWKMNVKTFAGRVRLSPPEEVVRASEHVDIAAGRESLFIAQGAGRPGATLAQQTAAIASSRLRPSWELKASEMTELARQWTMADQVSNLAPSATTAVARAPAAAAVCAAPEADFNQCSWTCVGAAAGDSKCRTDLPGVRCVRRVCRANGQWSDETRLPASQNDVCVPGQTVVKSCDY